MALDFVQIQAELKENRKAAVLSRAKAHQNRIKFHAETHVSPYLSQPLTDFLSSVKARIPDDKFKDFQALFRFPIKTNTVVATIWDKLYRIHDGRNPESNYQFLSSESRDDWEWYRQEVLHEPDVWRTLGWDFFKTEINSVLIVDLPLEQGSDKPEPYFYWLKIDRVITFDANPVTGQMNWIIFKISDNRIAVIDDVSYRVFETDGNNLIPTPIIDNAHGLGYCPARFFWDRPISLDDPDVKESPITKELEDLDWYLYYHISKKHLDTYAGYPIYSGYAMECDFHNDATGDYCDGGFLKNKEDHWVFDSNGLVKCPLCGNKRLSGAGSFVEVPVPGEGQPDLSSPVKIVTIDKNSLDYNVEEEKRLKDDIINSSVGIDGQIITTQAVNEKQVNATYENKSNILNRVKKSFENAQKWVDETVCRLRYGNDFLSASISLGTDFYMLSPMDLRNLYKNMKDSGASESELDSMQRKIIESEYRNNPLELQRMLILSDLEPYRHASRKEVIDMYKEGLIPGDTMRVKLSFPDYIRRFERENINIIEFGSALPYRNKIEKIQSVLVQYASEDENRISPKIAPKTLATSIKDDE